MDGAGRGARTGGGATILDRLRQPGTLPEASGDILKPGVQVYYPSPALPPLKNGCKSHSRTFLAKEAVQEARGRRDGATRRANRPFSLKTF